MGVDYKGVGGIGIRVNDEMIQTFIKNGLFTREEFDSDPSSCIESLGILFRTAGMGAYTGEPDTYYLMVEGKTLDEINQNVPDFIEKLNKLGINIHSEYLIVVSDILVW